MMIKKELHDWIVTQSILVPPETGGILGGWNEIVTDVKVDSPAEQNAGLYTPNIFYLNHCIDVWQKNGIQFLGIFHTHAPMWRSLSGLDYSYIERIMRQMPISVGRLYFPLVFPQDKLVPFVAVRKKENIVICEDSLVLMEGSQTYEEKES